MSERKKITYKMDKFYYNNIKDQIYDTPEKMFELDRLFCLMEEDVEEAFNKAISSERERIKEILKATEVCHCVDNHKCVICEAIDKEVKIE